MNKKRHKSDYEDLLADDKGVVFKGAGDERQAELAGLTRALAGHAAELFQPAESELEPVSERQLDEIMAAAEPAIAKLRQPREPRRHPGGGGGKWFLTTLALAASLALVSGLLVRSYFFSETIPEVGRGVHGYSASEIYSSVWDTRRSAASPVSRGQERGAVPVYCPNGVTFAAKPPIAIGGDPETEYEIGIFDLMGEPLAPPVKIFGGATLAWEEAGWPVLDRDEVYSVKLLAEGKPVNKPTFLLFLSTEAAAAQQAAMASIMPEHHSPKTEKFITAASLALNECFAEARQLALELAADYPENELFAKLAAWCGERIPGIGK